MSYINYLKRFLDSTEKHKNTNDNISSEAETIFVLAKTPTWVTHVSFLLFGIVNLFSWNAIVVQTVYFEKFMRKSLRDALNPTLCSFSMFAIILGNTLNIGVLFKLRSKVKIFTSLLIFLICFITIMTTVWFEAPDILYFVIVILIALCANIVQPIMMSALFEDLRVYPKLSFDMFNMGIAASGFISSTLSIILIPINISEKSSVMIFFFIAMFLILICLIVYYFMANSDFYKSNLLYDSDKQTDTRSALDKFRSMYIMLKLKLVDAFSIFFCLVVTLFVYPTLILTVKPISNNKEWHKYFHKVICFLAYGFGDTVGKYINVWFQWPKSQTKSMIFCSLIRFGFIILFLLCYRPTANIGIFIFQNDAFPFLLSFLLALTNAHLTNRGLSTPYLLKSAEDQIDCMRMIVFMLGLGLTIGAISSFSVKYL